MYLSPILANILLLSPIAEFMYNNPALRVVGEGDKIESIRLSATSNAEPSGLTFIPIMLRM